MNGKKNPFFRIGEAVQFASPFQRVTAFMRPNGDAIKRINSPITKAIQSIGETAKHFDAAQTLITHLLIDNGWPPPWSSPISDLIPLAQQHKQGQLNCAELLSVLLQHYNIEAVRKMLEWWGTNPYLANRMPLLKEAVESYEAGRYASAIAVLIPNIEGVVGDFFRRRPKAEKDVGKLFERTGFDSVAAEFYVEELYKSFGDWNNELKPGLRRHQILHGRDVAYGTQENALKALIMFDAVSTTVWELDGTDGLPET